MPPRCGRKQEKQPQTYNSKLTRLWQIIMKCLFPKWKRSVTDLKQKIMASNDTAEIELLSQDIEGIEDILSERDPMAED